VQDLFGTSAGFKRDKTIRADAQQLCELRYLKIDIESPP
jgi:hypothetical protein